MKNGSIKIGVFILIIIVVLLLGFGIGYLVFSGAISNKIEKEDSTIEQFENKEITPAKVNDTKNEVKIEPNIVNNNVNVEPTILPQYDGEQVININSKDYKVSYISKKYTRNDEGHTNYVYREVTLFLNDKKVANLNIEDTEDVNNTYGENQYKVELYNICKDYILILVKSQRDDGEYRAVRYANFCIINTDGMHIDSFKWNDETQVITKEGKYLEYEIENDGLVLYTTFTEWVNNISKSKAVKVKYSVIRDYIDEKYTETIEDVILAGK